MKYQVLVLMTLGLMGSQAKASDNWLCKEESSLRTSSSIQTCGIGYGASEKLARQDAFEAAKTEFKSICEASTSCSSLNVTVEPKRTTCDLNNNLYTCYRLVVFSLTETDKAPKIHLGMSKESMIESFGLPDKINHESKYTVLIYSGAMCTTHKKNNKCGVKLIKGRIVNIAYFKTQYTE